MLAKVGKDLEARLKIQCGCLRRIQYKHIGLLSVITLDNDDGQTTVDRGVREIGRVLDLMGKRVPIALSLDHQDLILPNGLPLELPDIPDPERPDRTSINDPIPHIPQRYADRASGETFAGGLHWQVFRPVRKIILLSDDKRLPWGNSAWPRIQCLPDFAGRHTTLLFNPESGRAHFVFGRFQFSTNLGRAEPAPRIELVGA